MHFVGKLWKFKIQMPWVVRVTKSQLLSMVVAQKVYVLRQISKSVCIFIDLFLKKFLFPDHSDVCSGFLLELPAEPRGLSSACVFLSVS